MKKMIVFGAAGGTGSEIVRQALDKGHYVTACVRNPAAFHQSHQNLTVVQADATAPGSFRQAMKGQDIVISALGNRSTQPTSLWSSALAHMIGMMQEDGTARLICISAGGLEVNPLNSWFVRFLTRYVLQRILKEPYRDLRRMEAEVRASGLDYTIIRPPRLLDRPLTGKYREAVNQPLPDTGSLSRADVAHYIVGHLSDERIFRSTVQIAY